METENQQGRAIATLTIAAPVTLSGKDANGVEFTERARTIAIARRGGKIETKCNLRPGAEITLNNPIMGRSSRIRVVKVEEKPAGEEAYEVEVQLLGSENIWGIDFPSPDEEEPQGETYSPVTAREVAASALLTPSVSKAVSSPEPAKTSILTPPLADSSLSIPQRSPLPPLAAVPKREAGQPPERVEGTTSTPMSGTRNTGDNELRLPEQKAVQGSRSSNPLGLPPVSDRARKLEGGNGLGGEDLKQLEGTVQACRGELWQLALELEEFKQAVRNEMDEALKHAQESRPKAEEKAGSGVDVKKETELAEEQPNGPVRQRVQEEAAAALEPQVQGALERVHSAAQEESVKAAEGIQGLFERLMQKGQDQLAQVIRSMTSELQNELRCIAAAALASAQTEISQAHSKSAVEFGAHLQKTTDELTESVAKQLRGQTEDTLLLLGEELKTISHECLKELKEESLLTLANVKAAADQAMKEVSSQVEQQVCALKKVSEEVRQESAQALAQTKREAAQVILEVYAHTRREVATLNELRNSIAKESSVLKFRQDLGQVVQPGRNGG